MDRDTKDPHGDTASIASSFVSVSPTASISTTFDDEPPPYSAIENEPPSQWTNRDPRSSSTQSLVTQDLTADSRRILLLVYIHGFMGNETSFQSFPAHVHNLVTVLLNDSHVVHTKIYPRYLTKRVLGVAAGDFSKWLAPHEGPNTDIILLGHSMGGLLAAEVALLPPEMQAAWPLRHRILGTINFDVPFLGMHPGVVKSGLTSIFKPYPAPAASPQPQTPGSSSEPFWMSGASDSTFNPAFPNDINIPLRKGWKSAMHFVNKHSNNLTSATRQLIQNHLEFGSCLAEFDNLKIRYVRLRMLEEESAEKRGSVVDGKHAPRVRFINYYTASTGRPKKAKSPAGESTPSLVTQTSSEPQRADSDLASVTETSVSEASGSQTRSASIPASLEVLDPMPDDNSDLSSLSDIDDMSTLDSLSTDTDGNSMSPGAISHAESMPTAPDKPPAGPLLINYRNDIAGFKIALAEHRKAHKEYAHALRDYHKKLIQWRKDDSKRRQVERKATLEARAEELKIEAEMRSEEQRQIANATDPEEKKMAIEAMRERRRREFELRREQLKRKVEEEKERRKEAADTAKSERKCEKKQLKDERKSEKDAQKNERKMLKDEIKNQMKMEKLGRKEVAKAGKQHKLGPGSKYCPGSSSASVPALSEVIYDATPDVGDSSSKPNIGRATSDGWRDEKASPSVASLESVLSKDSDAQQKKDKKFCLLPPKDSNGNPDYTWRRVFMQDVDEVGAHCGLFFPQGITNAEVSSEGSGWGDRYARLVGDVAERMESWVHEDMTDRLVRGVQALP